MTAQATIIYLIVLQNHMFWLVDPLSLETSFSFSSKEWVNNQVRSETSFIVLLGGCVSIAIVLGFGFRKSNFRPRVIDMTKIYKEIGRVFGQKVIQFTKFKA